MTVHMIEGDLTTPPKSGRIVVACGQTVLILFHSSVATNGAVCPDCLLAVKHTSCHHWFVSETADGLVMPLVAMIPATKLEEYK